MARTERLEVRLTPEERERIEHAVALGGRSLSSFVVEAAVARADAEIRRWEVTVLPADFFDEIMATVDTAEPPPALVAAYERARRSGHIVNW